MADININLNDEQQLPPVDQEPVVIPKVVMTTRDVRRRTRENLELISKLTGEDFKLE